jgi:hypothetical protein
MVVARGSADSTCFVVVNRPSDAQGERPVGNALAIVEQQASGHQASGRYAQLRAYLTLPLMPTLMPDA